MKWVYKVSAIKASFFRTKVASFAFFLSEWFYVEYRPQVDNWPVHYFSRKRKWFFVAYIS